MGNPNQDLVKDGTYMYVQDTFSYIGAQLFSGKFAVQYPSPSLKICQSQHDFAPKESFGYDSSKLKVNFIVCLMIKEK